MVTAFLVYREDGMNPYMHSLKPLWENAGYCSIDFNRLKEVAIKMAKENLIAPSWRGPLFPEADDELFIEFLGVINAINYCFTSPKTGNKFDTEYPEGSGTIFKGSGAMTACVKRALDNGIPILSPAYLAEFNRKEASKVFRCYANSMPMLTARITSLRNVGAALMSFGSPGSFSDLFKNADYRLFNSGMGIVERIAGQFLSYYDQSFWNGKRLLFYKRAQLLPMMYYGRALDSKGKLPLMRDPENFGVITDYALPNALRSFGILNYQKQLAEKIDNGRSLIAESREELEIRAVTARIMLKLLDAVNKFRKIYSKPEITMAELDYHVWQVGRNEKSRYKHHLTYTTAY